MLPGILKNIKTAIPILNAACEQEDEQEIGDECSDETIEEAIASVYNMSDCDVPSSKS